MGLFQDIISSIGNGFHDVFGGGGGDNNDQKKRQQQQSPVQTPAPTGGFNRSPVQLPAVFQAAQQQQQQQQNPLHLFNPSQQPNPLAPPQPAGPAAAPQINTQNYAQPAPSGPPHTSLWSHLLHGAADVGEGAAGVGAGAALGVLRAGEGLVQGAAQIPQMAIHLGAKGGELLSGDPNAGQGIDQAATNITNKVTAPVDWLAKKTDEATGMFNHEDGTPTITGKVIHDIYTPVQVGANVATVVPAVTAAAPRVAALLGDTGKAGDVLNGVNDFVKSQSEIPNLSRIPVIGTALSHIPGVGGGEAPKVPDEAAGSGADKVPVESGTKAPGEATNAPTGEAAPPEKTPNAVETGVKPPAAAPAEVEPAAPAEAVPAEPRPQSAAPSGAAFPGRPTTPEPAPNLLTKTGDPNQDLQNATQLVRNILENGRDYSGEVPGGKNALQHILDLANSHLNSNNIIAKAINSRMATLSEEEAGNVRNAIETGSSKGLSDKEAAVVKAIKENIEQPSSTVRANLNPDYQAANNHFPQVRNVGIKDAAVEAAKAKGVNGKISTFDDLLNSNSRFSEGSTLGNFTRGGKTVTGDANDLGLVPKKDGTFVDKAGKVYQYSRATSQDLENAGAKIQAPKDALTAYVRDTLNLKTRADAADYLIKNSDGMGLSDTQAPGKTESVSIKGSDGEDHTFFTDKKTAKNIKDSGLLGNFSKEANLPTKAWNALSSLIAQASVVNPFAHGLNLATNAAVGAGERANGITGASTLFRSLKPIDEATELRMSDAGVHFPTYGKDNVNLISKATGGLSKLNETAVAAIDRQARAGMFDNLTKGGMSDKEAAATINKWMGGRSVYKGDNAQLGIFWKYFVRQNANAGRLFTQAAQGHPGALINAAIAAGTTYAADQGLKSATGNQNAYIHPPGVVGVINDAATGAKDIASGQYRASVNPLVSHVNPLATQVAEQTLGVNNYGDKFKNGQERVANLLSMTPETNAFNDNGHSLAEKGLNTFGIYTPHVKGDEAAAPGTIPGKVLNVKGAQDGSTVAFPNDFTGESNAKAVNDYLSKTGDQYSSKTAATIASQTQEQQKAYTAATVALKKVGITSATDVHNFAQLSPDDQASYIKAANALNTAGTSLSSSTIEAQLVKDGKVDLAATLNKNIPSSLPPEDKRALETYSTLGSDGQKNVWLQDNNNAASYYDATIRQKQAQGALTTDDTDISAAWSGSGNSLYVKDLVAQTNKQNNVPQDVIELYKDTSKTEYEKMSGSKKDQLTAYAQQLNNNGITDKFGIATGTSGGSGRGGSGGSSTSAAAADRAAGLPYGAMSESFVKPTSDAGLKSVNARSFTAPKLLQYTPDVKSNPFVRSITATKGIK